MQWEQKYVIFAVFLYKNPSSILLGWNTVQEEKSVILGVDVHYDLSFIVCNEIFYALMRVIDTRQSDISVIQCISLIFVGVSCVWIFGHLEPHHSAN